MYQPAHFVESDADAIAGLIAASPLATLVTVGADGFPTAEHVPMLLDTSRGELGVLVGHVARANPVWRTPGPALVIFHGPDAYVSPNWYATKAEGGRVVPTWNYQVVQAYGQLQPIDDPGTVLGIVNKLTNAFEGPAAAKTGVAPWRVDDAPDDYVGKMVRAIVGLELEIERLEAKSKVSQNRPLVDREGVARGLRVMGDPGSTAIADRVPLD